MAETQIEELLSFWFDGDQSRWFMRDAAFDAELRDRFGALHERAVNGELDAWTATPRGALALVLLLDQLSRNLYRDDPRAFANDERALAITRAQLASGTQRELSPAERMFLLMPFEHSEDRAMQREGIAAFEKLAADAPGDAMIASALDYARRHAAVVERFGRFPHRNQVLGRTSSPVELAYLASSSAPF